MIASSYADCRLQVIVITNFYGIIKAAPACGIASGLCPSRSPLGA